MNSIGSDFDVYEANVEHRRANRAGTDGCDTLAKNKIDNNEDDAISIGETKFYSNEELGK